MVAHPGGTSQPRTSSSPLSAARGPGSSASATSVFKGGSLIALGAACYHTSMSLETFVLWLDVTAFVWGAIWGSFLNVVIYRLPAGLSLVKPPSRCPGCETQLRWYDNIPIFGWLLLRGRCRYCEVPIPIRYPAVELLTALLSLWVWHHVAHEPLAVVPVDAFGDVLLAVSMAFFFYFYFVALLIAITFIDLDETIIPHELTGAGVVLGLAAAFVVPTTGPMAGLWPGTDWLDALLGLLVGGGVIFGVIKGYALVRGIEGMGWGDFTLMGMVGVWVGWRGIVFVLFAAAIQGLTITLAVALFQKLRGKPAGEGGFFIDDIDAIDADPDELAARREAQGDAPADKPGFGQLAVPFGPFIALAAVEYVLLGHLALPWFFAP